MNRKTEEYVALENSTIGVVLTHDKVAIIDAKDFNLIAGRRWQLKKGCGDNLYAYASITIDGKRKTKSMHQILLNPPKGMMCDHANGDGLDNRRSNIRLATHQQNQWNREATKRVGRNSKYRGVQINPRWLGKETRRKWRANITLNNKKKSLGYYHTEEEAALAFNQAAILYHGEFARLNIIGDENGKQ